MPRWSPADLDADRRLVAALNEHTDGSLAELYDRYGERLYDYCLSMAWEPRSAADVVHDAFIDAYRRLPRLRNRERLRSWLYAAARRRCVQRSRTRGVFLDWGGTAETDPDTGLPFGEVRELVEASLTRLDFADQEILLLGVRHGLRGPALAATLGIGPRRVAARLSKARARFESAVAAELLALSRECANAAGPARALHPGEAEAELSDRTAALAADDSGAHTLPRHVAGCKACEQRGRICAGTLLERAPVAVLPAALRHRIMHTATDPELGAYRADIAARGGNLTTDGLPRQPDVPAPLTQHWMFVGGGAAGALGTAMLATVLALGSPFPGLRVIPYVGPDTDRPNASSSGGGDGESSGRPPPQAGSRGGRNSVPTWPDASGDGYSTPPADPESPSPGQTPSPTPTTSRPSKGGPRNPPAPGQLLLDSTILKLAAGTRQGYIGFRAVNGPVTWSAVASTDRLTLSRSEGDLTRDASDRVLVLLNAELITLPGQATVTFSDLYGASQTVTVTWGLSIL